VTGGRLDGGNSTGVAMRAEQRRRIGGRERVDRRAQPSVVEAHTCSWAGFTRGSSPGSVQSWADAEKTAHDPFSIFKFLFQLNKSTGENKTRRNT
jgi:hypothetical protein